MTLQALTGNLPITGTLHTLLAWNTHYSSSNSNISGSTNKLPPLLLMLKYVP
jgi:hypothetical protein